MLLLSIKLHCGGFSPIWTVLNLLCFVLYHIWLLGKINEWVFPHIKTQLLLCSGYLKLREMRRTDKLILLLTETSFSTSYYWLYTLLSSVVHLQWNNIFSIEWWDLFPIKEQTRWSVIRFQRKPYRPLLEFFNNQYPAIVIYICFHKMRWTSHQVLTLLWSYLIKNEINCFNYPHIYSFRSLAWVTSRLCSPTYPSLCKAVKRT